MTEIAVVSEYTIDDIWAMRGKYSDAATEMGAKTIDLVDATKLLVQQGLSLNQSLETGIEVTKMARIANLSGADATNLMTAQLRGFNMEMSEANRVSDVFSNLAAKHRQTLKKLRQRFQRLLQLLTVPEHPLRIHQRSLHKQWRQRERHRKLLVLLLKQSLHVFRN